MELTVSAFNTHSVCYFHSFRCWMELLSPARILYFTLECRLFVCWMVIRCFFSEVELVSVSFVRSHCRLQAKKHKNHKSVLFTTRWVIIAYIQINIDYSARLLFRSYSPALSSFSYLSLSPVWWLFAARRAHGFIPLFPVYSHFFYLLLSFRK